MGINRSRERQAEVDLADAEIKLERMRRLSREQIASPEQLETAELARRSAELRLEQAREAVRQALASLITQQFQGVGATHMIVLPNQQSQQGPGVVAKQVKLTWEDGQALRDEVPGIDPITPVIIGNEAVKYRQRQHRTLVLGVNGDWPEVSNHAVDTGRFFSAIDLEHRRKVAVIGQEVVEELRLGADAVGKEIYVGTLPATVIGVMEERGQFVGQNIDDLVFIPFQTSLQLFGRRAADQVQLRMQAASAEVTERVRDDIARVLRRRHRIGPADEDDFQVLLQDEIVRSVNTVLGSVTAVVAAVVGVALLVGGIGIMNIMLVSVTERTREIGIRKSVGARRQDILLQFLIEAITLSLLGGALGVSIGYGIGALVASLLPGDWPAAHVPWWAVALAFGFSALVGIFFGIYPAGKAARLDPIEALRYE